MALAGELSLVGFAFSAGAFTFFAPCAYPLLPGYVSYYLGRGSPGGDGPAEEGNRPTGSTPDGGTPAAGWVTRQVTAGFALGVSEARAARLARAAVVGVLVSSGFFLVYGLLAGVVVALGAQILAGISILELVVGVFLVLVGGAMALGWSLPTATASLPERRRSVAGYVGFGVIYAAAAAGCTAPVFVGVALEGIATGPGAGLATLLAYAAGMSTLMVGVTVATALGRDALLSWLTRRMDLIERVAGVLLLLAGVAEIYLFVFRFQGLALLGL